jgi:hypothetical protein
MEPVQTATRVEHPDIVFDVIGRTAAPGVTWLWARSDLDVAGVSKARIELSGLAGLLAGAPRRVLVYVGAERVVDQCGTRLLHHLAVLIRRNGGDLALVAPSPSLRRAVTELGLARELPMLESVGRAAWWARTQARSSSHQPRPGNGCGEQR